MYVFPVRSDTSHGARNDSSNADRHNLKEENTHDLNDVAKNDLSQRNTDDVHHGSRGSASGMLTGMFTDRQSTENDLNHFGFHH
jgi:hypothetical protein